MNTLVQAMRRQTGIAVAGALAMLLAGPLLAADVDITLNSLDGSPVVVRVSPGYNATHPAGLAMNRDTGTLYWGQTWNGGKQLHKSDSSVTKKLSAANATSNDANMGIISYTANNTFYNGSVALGAQNSIGPAFPGWIPTSDTLMTQAGVSSALRIIEVISQTGSEATGVVNEGASTASGGPNVTNGAVGSVTTMATATGNQGGGQLQSGGLAWTDHVNISGTDYDRFFFAHQKYQTNDPAKVIRLAWMTDAINGWTSTAYGSRTALQLHNNSLTDSLVMDDVTFDALVPAVADYIRDMAVFNGMLFILSNDGTATGDTYLSAIKYTLPTDGTTAVSYTLVNLGGGTDYLNLDGLLTGAGVTSTKL
ncbi:MAG: hypothetical protein BIFFINMI_00268 [Phycisphaerae bacterium]|nr:hypothetical protein [Phycisphaerae bacterium]